MINDKQLSFLNSQLSFEKRSMTYWTKQKVIFFSTSWKYISPAQLTDVSSVNDKKESRKGHMADALALGGDEGRDKLR